jgi:hypothetical protein
LRGQVVCEEAEIVPNDLAALHHKRYALESGGIAQRIISKSHGVGQLAGFG